MPGLFPGSENKKLKPPIDLLPFKEEYTSVTVGWKTHFKEKNLDFQKECRNHQNVIKIIIKLPKNLDL